MPDLHPEVLALIEAGPRKTLYHDAAGNCIDCDIDESHEEFARRIALRQHEIDERENADLRAKLEEATKDAERLTFYEANADKVLNVGTVWYSREKYGAPVSREKNMRAAIDAAIAAGKGEK